MLDTANPQVFDELKTVLEGTTILKAPRVSRETIISVLQTHTELLNSLKKDQRIVASRVGMLETESKHHERRIDDLNEEQEQVKRNIESLFRLSNEFRKEMDELSEKVTELYVLKKQLNEQREFIEDLSSRYEAFNTEVTDFMSHTTETVTEVRTLCNDTQFQLTELKDYVDHFADNLVLSSQQITVESSAGLSTKAINLTDALKLCTGQFNDLEDKHKDQEKKIKDISTELETKAPDSVLFNINALEKKVSTIEIHLQREEEQGIGAIRKTCDQLTSQVQSISTELAEKIDQESVGFIVHEKYEEIVRYLQDALQSSMEDENNFKQKADEIQEMVLLLSNSKADRSEINSMQELMVKSEALLKKVGAQVNIKERLREMVSRKELEEMLAEKVDRDELQYSLQQAASNSKKNRRSSINAGDLDNVEDGINHLPPVYGAESNAPFRPGDSGAPVIAIGRNVGSPNSRSKTGEFAAYVKNKQKMVGSKSTSNLPTPGAPGVFRNPTEGGKPGGPEGGSGKHGKGNTDGYGRTEYPYVPPAYDGDYQQKSAVTDHLSYLHGPIVGGGFNTHSHHLQSGMPKDANVPEQDLEGKGLMLKGSDGHFYYTDDTLEKEKSN